MNPIRKTVATVAVAGTLLGGGMAAPAFAQPVSQDGLVNVNVSGNEILNDVNVAVAANAAVLACDVLDVTVNQVAVLSRAIAVDRSGRTQTICRTDQGDVTISQN